MPSKILANLFTGVPPEAKMIPIEFSIEEISVMIDALRLLRDTQTNWKPGHRKSAGAKLMILSNAHTDAGRAEHEDKLVLPATFHPTPR